MQLLTGVRSAGVVLEAPTDSTRILYLLGYDRTLNPETNVISVFQPPPKRAWVARCAEPGGVTEVRDGSFPLFSCVTAGDQKLGDRSSAPGSATIDSEKPGKMAFSAQGPGYLFTGIPFYPGWTAKVDGKDADVTATRVDQVQQFAMQLVPDGPLPPVMVTNIPSDLGQPASVVDNILRKYEATIPNPRLPDGGTSFGGTGQ